MLQCCMLEKDKHILPFKKQLKLRKKVIPFLVHEGLYKEHTITVNKSIVLKGIHYPVIDGENKYEIISVKSNNVTIDGFKIQHSGASSLYDIAGIKIYNCHNVTISNNILDDTFFGIYSSIQVITALLSKTI